MAERGTGLPIKQLGPMAAAITRLFTAPPNTIRGIDGNGWFDPLQPVAPVAPIGTEPRGWQYWPGQNLNFTPRADAKLNAEALRKLSTYFLARICIENVKDIICDLPRQVTVKPLPGETKKDTQDRAKGDKTLQKLNDFFDYPDGYHNWSEWVRPLLEDMLVGDWASVLLRRDPKSNELIEARVIQGDTITRYIDMQGWTPAPPSPAYAQLWYGIPMVNLTTDQLIYKPRNIVIRNTDSSHLYGMSPTEQGAEEINIGQNRMNFVAAYYTEGVIPDLLQVAPADVSADKILEQMQDFNSAMAGQLGKRRGMRTIPGFTEKGDDQIIQPKAILLADPFDDVHIRKICFQYGTSPQRLLKAMNRASADASQDAAEEEGTAPWVTWLKSSICDYIIHRKFMLPGYQMSFDTAKEPDIAKLSTAQKTWISCGAKTVDNVREDNGDDPYGLPETSKPFVLTATGPVPLDTNDAIAQGTAKQAAGLVPDQNKPPEPELDDEGKPKPAEGEEEPEAGKKPAKGFSTRKKKRVGKARARIDTGVLTPKSHAAKVHIADHLTKVFRRQRDRVASDVKTILQKHGYQKMRKADAPDPGDVADELFAAIEAEFGTIPAEVRPALEEALLSGIAEGMTQLNIADTDMIQQANTLASDYASTRAAEMVGMKYDADGNLVQNPNAEWAISDTTRQRLREILTQAFEANTSVSDIVSDILDADAFSPARAEMIAATEVQMAQTQGNFDMWKKSGVVLEVSWQLSNDHDDDDICDDLADDSPYPIGDCPLPVFDSHPNCHCVIIASKTTED